MEDKKLLYDKTIATLYGNPDISDAFVDCYNFLKENLPITGMHVGRSLADSTQVVARCEPNQIATNTNYQHSEEATKYKSKLEAQKIVLPDGMIVNDARHPIISFFKKIKKTAPDFVVPTSPFYFIRVIHDKKFIGGILFFYEENNPLTDEQKDFLTSLQVPFRLVLSNALQHIELQEYKKKHLPLTSGIPQTDLPVSADIIGKASGLKDTFTKMCSIAHLDINVFIGGETGTGKEVLARALHEHSCRNNQPFIAVNCAAIASSLIDSELFGHEKGAFTGALTYKKGYFERAHKGTIFLDEIADLSLESQARLLRVLQDGVVNPVGGEKELALDFHLISATNADLSEKIKQGLFREDLYFRICEFNIDIPPLRERKEDIPDLAHFFLNKYMGLFNVSQAQISNEDLIRLQQYSWPGNVRELQNQIKSSLALMKPNDVYLRFPLFHTPPSLEDDEIFLTFDQMQRKYFNEVLEKTKGKISGKGGAASITGIEPNTLRSKLEKLQVKYKKVDFTAS